MIQWAWHLPFLAGAPDSTLRMIRAKSLACSPRITRNTESQPGQALVEFALVLPLLILLLVAMFDLGRGVYSYNVVASAAREGARYAIVKPTDTAGIQTTAFAVTPALDQTQLTMDAPVCKTPAGSAGSCTTGHTISITVHYRFLPVTPFFAALNLVGKSTMNIE